MQQKNRQSNNTEIQQPKGFTIIEVMIALLIVALVFGAMLNFSKSYIKNFSSLEERYWANQVAWNKVIELHSKITGLKNLTEKTETYNMLGFDWYVHQNIESTVTEGIEKVTFEVGAQEDIYTANISTFIILDASSIIF